jgi:glycosyltransferase involved in cell wall biosynthesis
MNRTVCLFPFYNEEHRLDKEVFKGVFAQNIAVDFWLLNDGSTDRTLQLLEELAGEFKHVKVVNNPVNLGKAEVIRRGMELACGAEGKGFEYIGFLDSDFATPYYEFDRLRLIIEDSNYDIVWGSRVKLKGWDVRRNIVRHWFSRIILTIINTIFGLEIYDTQCGCKLFKREVAQELFANSFVTKWLFDIEVFIRYKRWSSVERLYEVPLVQWTEIKGSKIKMKDFMLVPFNIMKLWWNYRG